MTRQDPRGMLSRGLAILIALGEKPEGMVLTDIARVVNLPVSTVHRLLNTEVELGFVSFDKSRRRYNVGVRVFELAHQVSSVRSLSEVARPTMQALSEATGETIQLAILADDSVMFVERVGVDRVISIRGSVGQREPSYCTSTGKMLLSQLDDMRLDETLARLNFQPWTEHTITDADTLREHLVLVRERDFATADEEFDAQVRALAVPVRNERGVVTAALCITAPVFRVDQDLLLSWLPLIRNAAHTIGIQLPTS